MSDEKVNAVINNSEDTIVYKNEIGKGSYGVVWSAVWNGSKVAAKRIHEEVFRNECGQEIIDHHIGEFRREWEVLRDLDHPNIVKMHTVLFPLNKSPVIVMELMHCDLEHYIKKSTSTPKVSLSEGLSISLGVAEGLEHLHGMSPPIVHRDLATKNILLTADGRPKIADLGVAKVFAAGKDALATAKPGTPLYAAPETYKNIRSYVAKYGKKVDIFSFGVVLLAIIVGHEPVVFPVGPPKDVNKMSEVKRRQKDIKLMEDHLLKQLVLDCLQEKSSSRPNASKIVKELKTIKFESEGKGCTAKSRVAQCDSAVTFEKVSGQPTHDYKFKVLLLGNREVGKSCLYEVLINPAYKLDYIKPVTMGIFSTEQWFEYNSSFVNMEIVDTAGEERFFALTASYFRDVDGVFLVYNVSDKDTLNKLPFWINSIKNTKSRDDHDVQMLLVGNKVDLRQNMESEEMVPQEKALEFADKFGFPYVETSAKDIDSVMMMYKKMIEILIGAVRVEDVVIQVRKEAKSTIKLPSSPFKQRVLNKVNCPSCKNS